MDEVTKRKNTDDLLAFMRKNAEHAAKNAAEETDAGVRRITLMGAFDKEWHTLWSCIMCDAFGGVFDTVRLATRLDEMRAEMADPNHPMRQVAL